MDNDQKFNNAEAASLFNNGKFDEAAFEIFFKKNYIPLFTYCQYKFGFNQDGSKEIVHAAFIKLWENRHTLSPQTSVIAYLYKIITNNALDILKHEKVKQKYQSHVMLTTAEAATNDLEKVDGKELKEQIDKAIASLPLQMRTIFELSRFEGLKYAEIAQHLNLSVKTVETQMSRALTKLRQLLGHYLLVLIVVLLSFFMKT